MHFPEQNELMDIGGRCYVVDHADPSTGEVHASHLFDGGQTAVRLDPSNPQWTPAEIEWKTWELMGFESRPVQGWIGDDGFSHGYDKEELVLLCPSDGTIWRDCPIPRTPGLMEALHELIEQSLDAMDLKAKSMQPSLARANPICVRVATVCGECGILEPAFVGDDPNWVYLQKEAHERRELWNTLPPRVDSAFFGGLKEY